MTCSGAVRSPNAFGCKDVEVAADFASIECDITVAGRVKLSAPRTSSGHGDRFWAAALAVHAAVTHKPFKLVMAV